MYRQNIYYLEEKQHASERLFAVVVMTLFSFILLGQSKGEIAEKAFLTGFALLALTIFSILHFYFISTYPNKLVAIRKTFLIVADLGVLTFLIIINGAIGIFLLPLYILTVMRAGLSFGVSYFYMSLLLAGALWVIILAYSPYWESHSDVIASFAITTMLIPLFYINFIARIHEENDELTQTLNDVSYDANYDELTGAANRKQYKRTIMDLVHEKEPFVLLFIDLNKFKAINDTYGHHIGDEVLKAVARKLLENIDEDDFLARLGGDEFVIITKRKKIFIDKFLEKLEQNVIGRYHIGSLVIPIELSIGVSYYPDDSNTVMMLSKYADEAMYMAKKSKERYHYYYHEIKNRKQKVRFSE